MKYQEFKRAFESSGLNQKDYAAHKGISPSMVSYYLRKARETSGHEELEPPSVPPFQQIELINQATTGSLRIDLPQGIVLTLTI